jgi:hypothetical protein
MACRSFDAASARSRAGDAARDATLLRRRRIVVDDTLTVDSTALVGRMAPMRVLGHRPRVLSRRAAFTHRARHVPCSARHCMARAVHRASATRRTGSRQPLSGAVRAEVRFA